jgi:hypothetical protein
MPLPADPAAVTATNFQDAPHSAWGFHHVRELHPTAKVWRGSGPVWELPEEPRGIDAIAYDGADGARRTVADMIAENYLDGFMVLHKGAVALETYGHGMRPQDTHILMSSTKSFTGSLAGILADRGVLDTGARVTQLVPSLAGTAYDGATVRHLLDMRVGLDFSEAYLDPKCDFAYMDAACGWRPPIEPGAPDNLADFMATIRAKPPHGGAFHYVSANSVVLGWVLEAVSGERFADLLARLIWQPMGAEFDADLVLDRCGRSQTEGGLNVTLRDLARFGELHRLGGRGIVPAAWIEDMHRNGDADAWDRGTMAHVMPGHHYRSQWYTNIAHAHRPFFTAGAFGQIVFVDPVAELVIAKLSCFPGTEDDGLFGDMFRAFFAIAHALSDN